MSYADTRCYEINIKKVLRMNKTELISAANSMDASGIITVIDRISFELCDKPLSRTRRKNIGSKIGWLCVCANHKIFSNQMK